MAYFYTLKPHKGTPLYERLKREGRIIDESELDRRPGIHCEVTPTYCSARELEEKVRNMYDDFSKVPSMLRRLPLPVTKSHIASWILSFSQRRMSRSDRPISHHDWV